MFKVADKLYVAGCRDCVGKSAPGTVYVYCCQWPCHHAKNVGAQAACPARLGEAPQNYLRLANLEIPHYHPEDFNRYLDLLDQHLHVGEVVLVSEHGESRAPSLALLWMVFRGGYLSRSCFAAARSDFSRIYPHYLPWPGWIIFFEQEWDAFR